MRSSDGTSNLSKQYVAKTGKLSVNTVEEELVVQSAIDFTEAASSVW